MNPSGHGEGLNEPIRSLLVANRGEISIRVMRAAAEMDIRTVAIYASEDRFALHRFKADESYLVGAGRKPIAAYLDIDDIIRIAREARVEAIHPGYGFLSENPDFAEACARNGLVFIGPTPEVMRVLGNKVAARNAAVAAGVAVMPATGALPKNVAQAKRLAGEIGYPLMLKASWGGGGRGMRVRAKRTCRATWKSPAVKPWPPSVTTRCTWRNCCAAPATSRCKFWAIRTATSCTSSSGTVPCSGALLEPATDVSSCAAMTWLSIVGEPGG